MANPDVAMAFQNPRIQQAIMDVCDIYIYFLNNFLALILLWFPSVCCSYEIPKSTVSLLYTLWSISNPYLSLQCSQNPLNITKYQNDKEVISWNFVQNGYSLYFILCMMGLLTKTLNFHIVLTQSLLFSVSGYGCLQQDIRTLPWNVRFFLIWLNMEVLQSKLGRASPGGNFKDTFQFLPTS